MEEEEEGSGVVVVVKQAQRFNDNVDGFLHGLVALRERLGKEVAGIAHAAKEHANANANGKGKGKKKEVPVLEPPEIRLVLVVERAERLKDNLPDLIVPLTRLAELVSCSFTLSRVCLKIVLLKRRWGEGGDNTSCSFTPRQTGDHVAVHEAVDVIASWGTTWLFCLSGSPLSPSRIYVLCANSLGVYSPASR